MLSGRKATLNEGPHLPGQYALCWCKATLNELYLPVNTLSVDVKQQSTNEGQDLPVNSLSVDLKQQNEGATPTGQFTLCGRKATERRDNTYWSIHSLWT